MGLNNLHIAHNAGRRIGLKNHAAFEKQNLYELQPDIIVPLVVNPASWSYSVSAVHDSSENRALRGIYGDSEFTALYRFCLLTRRNGGPQPALAAWVHRRRLKELHGQLDLEIREFPDQRPSPDRVAELGDAAPRPIARPGPGYSSRSADIGDTAERGGPAAPRPAPRRDECRRRERNRRRVGRPDAVQLHSARSVRATTPRRSPLRGRRRRAAGLAKHAAGNLRAERAERHANADLARAPGHRIGDHAVEPDDRQQRRHRAEGGGQAGDQPFVDDRLAHLLVERRDAEHRHARIDRRQRTAHRREVTLGILRRSHVERDVLHPVLPVGERRSAAAAPRGYPCSVCPLTTPTISTGVGVPGFGAEAEAPSDGIGVLEIALRERLVHHRDAIRPATRRAPGPPVRRVRRTRGRPRSGYLIAAKYPGLTALAIEPADSPAGGW